MSDSSQINSTAKPVVVTSGAVKSTAAKPEASQELAIMIAQAAAERKAGDIVVLRVDEVSYIADYFVIVTGYSRVQVRAIASAIEEKVGEEYLRHPLRTEGKAEGTWVLQDYGEVIVHIMMPTEREFYNLEAFWGHAETIEFQNSGVDGGLTP